MAKGVRAGLLLLLLLSSQELSAGARIVQSQACQTPSSQMVLTSVHSTLYGQSVAVNLYLPPCYAASPTAFYPVIYLLHGSNTDETQWPDLKVQSYADALIASGAAPFIVVMPGGAYYNPIDYGAFVFKDLLPAIESHYAVERARAGRATGGLSIGAYYAFRLAFTHPELFTAIGGYSPVVDRGELGDPMALARHIDVKKLDGLAVDLNVGDQDSLLASTRQFAALLQARGVNVSYTVGQGAHNRVYWRAHTGEYLAFFSRIFARNLSPTLSATPSEATF